MNRLVKMLSVLLVAFIHSDAYAIPQQIKINFPGTIVEAGCTLSPTKNSSHENINRFEVKVNLKDYSTPGLLHALNGEENLMVKTSTSASKRKASF